MGLRGYDVAGEHVHACCCDDVTRIIHESLERCRCSGSRHSALEGTMTTGGVRRYYPRRPGPSGLKPRGLGTIYMTLDSVYNAGIRTEVYRCSRRNRK